MSAGRSEVPRWLKIGLGVIAVVVGSCGGCMTLGVMSAKYGSSDVHAVCNFAVTGRPLTEVRRFANERSVSGSDYPAKAERPAHTLYHKGRTYCDVEHDGTLVVQAKASFLGLVRSRIAP